MTITPPTLPQTIILLSLSRGQQPPIIPPVTRRELLRKRWIAHAGTRQVGSGGERPTFVITTAGSEALATSKHRDEAERALAKDRSKLWQGLT